MSLFIDGVTLSALFFNHLHSNECQFGFLLGMRVNHTENRISDSQSHSSKTNTLTYVSSFIPWIGSYNMYHRNGMICMETMDYLLQNTNQNLLGWYSFRHQSKYKPSLKECNLHTNLVKSCKFMENPEDFLFFLCTTSCNEKKSTHICNHGFMQFTNRQFIEVPMMVVNLGDTTGKEYQQLGNGSISDSQSLQRILLQHRSKHISSSEEMEQIKKISSLSTSLNKEINAVSVKIAESETSLCKLNIDVCHLKKLVTEYEQKEIEIMLAEQDADLLQQRSKDKQRKEQLQTLLNNLSAKDSSMNILTSSKLLLALDDHIN